MSYSLLGAKIKVKYPQYSDMSDEELGKKMVAKYPQYQDIVKEKAPQTTTQKVAKMFFTGGNPLLPGILGRGSEMPVEGLPRLQLPEHKDSGVLNFILKDLPEGVVNQIPSSIESIGKLQKLSRSPFTGEQPEIQNVQQAVGETANAALLPLTFVGGGAAGSVAKTGGKVALAKAVGKGMLQGAKIGGLWGGLAGLHSGQYKDVGGQLLEAGTGAATGAAGGALVGGATAGVGYGLRKIFGGKVPEELSQAVEKGTEEKTVPATVKKLPKAEKKALLQLIKDRNALQNEVTEMERILKTNKKGESLNYNLWKKRYPDLAPIEDIQAALTESKTILQEMNNRINTARGIGKATTPTVSTMWAKTPALSPEAEAVLQKAKQAGLEALTPDEKQIIKTQVPIETYREFMQGAPKGSLAQIEGTTRQPATGGVLAKEPASPTGTVLPEAGTNPAMSSQSLPYATSVTQPDDVINKYMQNVSMEPPKEPRIGVKAWLDDMYTKIVRRFYPIEKLTKEGQVASWKDPKNVIKRVLGSGGIAEEKVRYGTSRIDPTTGKVVYTGDGLEKILEPINGQERDFVAYMGAQRDLELATHGKHGINPKMAPDVLKALQAKYGDLSVFDQTARGVRDWAIRAMLDPLEEVGAISPELKGKILSSNQFYIPMMRVVEELEKNGYVSNSTNIFIPKKFPLKGIQGSQRQVVNPLESLITNNARITDFVEKLRVAKSIVDLRNTVPGMENVIVRVKPKMMPAGTNTMTAEVDQEFIDNLTLFAKELGLRVFKTQGQPGRTLGYYKPGTKEVVRRFATSRETLAHEIGHFLDDTFGLYENFLRNKKLTKAVGQELYEHSLNAGESASRVANPKERFANAFSWWMTHRDLAEEDMPLFSKAMQKIIKKNPDLTALLEIKPTPSPTLETMSETLFRPNIFSPGENVISVFGKDGAREYYKVPPDVFQAMSGFNEEQMNMITQLLSKPAMLQRAGATLSPEFAMRNPIRDNITAYIYSKYNYRPFWDFGRGLFHVLKKDDLYHQWAAQGGKYATLVSIDRQSSRDMLTKVMHQEPKLWKNPLKAALRALQGLSETMEEGTRLGLYKRALEKGASNAEAIYESREGTLDFAERGAKTKALNAIIAFWNATVQGDIKLAKAFKANPKQTAARVAASITLPSLLLYAVNRNNPRYQELPQWQKDFFWIVDIGKDKPLIRIPKPFELGIIFGSGAEHLAAYVLDKDPQAASSLLGSALSGMMPGLLPTAVEPAIENWANKSFFTGRPIVSPTLQRLPAEMQYTDRTSYFARELGKAIKEYTGYGVSPDQIDNLWYGYTATLGKMAMEGLDLGLEATGIEKTAPKPSPELSDIVGIKAFITREPIGSQSESVNKFYTYLQKSEEAKAGINKLEKTGNQQELIKFIRSHPEIYMNRGLNSISDTFSQLRKTKDMIMQSESMSPEDKRIKLKQIDQQMTTVANKIVKMYELAMERMVKTK